MKSRAIQIGLLCFCVLFFVGGGVNAALAANYPTNKASVNLQTFTGFPESEIQSILLKNLGAIGKPTECTVSGSDLVIANNASTKDPQVLIKNAATVQKKEYSATGTITSIWRNIGRDADGDLIDLTMKCSNIHYKVRTKNALNGVSKFICCMRFYDNDRPRFAAYPLEKKTGTWDDRKAHAGVRMQVSISFTKHSNGASANGTYMFYGQDIDQPDKVVTSTKPYPYTTKPYTETFLLKSGFPGSTVYFHTDTVMKLTDDDGARISPTAGTDSNTFRSGFATRTNPSFSFWWTGSNCMTTLFNQMQPLNVFDMNATMINGGIIKPSLNYYGGYIGSSWISNTSESEWRNNGTSWRVTQVPRNAQNYNKPQFAFDAASGYIPTGVAIGTAINSSNDITTFTNDMTGQTQSAPYEIAFHDSSGNSILQNQDSGISGVWKSGKYYTYTFLNQNGNINSGLKMIRNYYVKLSTQSVDPGTLTIPIRKKLTMEMDSDKEFTFDLYAGDSATGTPIQTKTITIPAHSTEGCTEFSFVPEISYEWPGVDSVLTQLQTYTINERVGEDSSISYDSTPITATLTATMRDNTTQPMTYALSYMKGSETIAEPTFTNKAKYGVSVIKQDAETGEVLPGAIFGLYEDAMSDNPLTTAESNDQGIATFSDALEYSNLIENTYYIKEIKAPLGFTVNSDFCYSISATRDKYVIINGTNSGERVEPGNVYLGLDASNICKNEHTSLTIDATKTVVGNTLQASEYKFGLYKDENCTETIATTTNDEQGNIQFNLKITTDDIGDHYYYMKEINTGNPQTTYDNQLWRVKVTVDNNLNITKIYYKYSPLVSASVAITDWVNPSGSEIEIPHSGYEKTASASSKETAWAQLVNLIESGQYTADNYHLTFNKTSSFYEYCIKGSHYPSDTVYQLALKAINRSDLYANIRIQFVSRTWIELTSQPVPYFKNEYEARCGASATKTDANNGNGLSGAVFEIQGVTPDAKLYNEDGSETDDCQHAHLSEPWHVSFCLNSGEVDCCPDDDIVFETCLDCGKVRAIEYDNLCGDCCNDETTISEWNDLLDQWISVSDTTSPYYGLRRSNEYKASFKNQGASNSYPLSTDTSIFITTGEDGVAKTHNKALVIGQTYKIREVKAPSGYQLSDSEWKEFTPQNQTVTIGDYTVTLTASSMICDMLYDETSGHDAEDLNGDWGDYVGTGNTLQAAWNSALFKFLDTPLCNITGEDKFDIVDCELLLNSKRLSLSSSTPPLLVGQYDIDYLEVDRQGEFHGKLDVNIAIENESTSVVKNYDGKIIDLGIWEDEPFDPITVEIPVRKNLLIRTGLTSYVPAFKILDGEFGAELYEYGMKIDEVVFPHSSLVTSFGQFKEITYDFDPEVFVNDGDSLTHSYQIVETDNGEQGIEYDKNTHNVDITLTYHENVVDGVTTSSWSVSYPSSTLLKNIYNPRYDVEVSKQEKTSGLPLANAEITVFEETEISMEAGNGAPALPEVFSDMTKFRSYFTISDIAGSRQILSFDATVLESECGIKPITTINTGIDGKGMTFDGALESGKVYYLLETSSPFGTSLDIDNMQVFVLDDYTDSGLYAHIDFTPRHVVEDYFFHANEDGTAVTPMVAPARFGYAGKIGETSLVWLSDGFVFQNEKIAESGGVRVQKLDAIDQSPLEDADFTIYDEVEYQQAFRTWKSDREQDFGYRTTVLDWAHLNSEHSEWSDAQELTAEIEAAWKSANGNDDGETFFMKLQLANNYINPVADFFYDADGWYKTADNALLLDKSYIVIETEPPSGYALPKYDPFLPGGSNGWQRIVPNISNGYTDVADPFVDTLKEPDETSVILSFSKMLESGSVPAAGAFEFQLCDENGSVLKEVANDSEGDVSFGNALEPLFTYRSDEVGADQPETFTYTLREKIPIGAIQDPDDASKMIAGDTKYDSREYTVLITVGYDKEGSYEAQVSYELDGVKQDSVNFVNNQIAPTVHYMFKPYDSTLYEERFSVQIPANTSYTILQYDDAHICASRNCSLLGYEQTDEYITVPHYEQLIATDDIVNVGTTDIWLWATETLHNDVSIHYMWKPVDGSWSEVAKEDIEYNSNHTTKTAIQFSELDSVTLTEGCSWMGYGLTTENTAPPAFDILVPGSTENNIVCDLWIWAIESRNTYPVHYMWKGESDTGFTEVKTVNNAPYGSYSAESIASAGVNPTTGCTTAAWGKTTINTDPGSYNAVAPASSTEITGETWFWGTESRNTYPVHYMWKGEDDTSFSEVKTVNNVPYGSYTTETIDSAGVNPTTGCTTAAWGKTTINTDPGSYNAVAPASSTEVTGETWFWGTESRNKYPVHYMWKGENDTSFTEVKTVNNVPYGSYTTETIASAGVTPTTGCTTAAWGKTTTNTDPGSYNAVAPTGSTEVSGETWFWGTESRNTYPVHYMWKGENDTSFSEVKTVNSVPYGSYTTETIASANITPTAGCTTAAWGKTTTNTDPGSYNAVAPTNSTEITGETWFWGTESRNTYPVHYMWKGENDTSFTEVKTVNSVPYGNYTTEAIASAGVTPTTGCTTAAWGKTTTNADPGSYNTIAPAGSTEITGETWFWGTETRNTYSVHYMWKGENDADFAEVKTVDNVPHGNYTTETISSAGATPTAGCTAAAWGKSTTNADPGTYNAVAPAGSTEIAGETWFWGTETRNTYPVHYMWKGENDTSFTEVKTVDNVPHGNYTTETVTSAGATPTTGCTSAAWGKSTINTDPGSYNTVAPAGSTEITGETWFWGTESRNTYSVHYMWKGENDTSFTEIKTVDNVPYGDYTTETVTSAGATPTTGCTSAAWGKSTINTDPGTYNTVAPAASIEITGETWLWGTESRNTYPVHYMWKGENDTSFTEVKTASDVPHGNYTTEILASAGATVTTGCTSAAWGKTTINTDPGTYNAVAPAGTTEITGETWLWGTEKRNTYPVHYMWKGENGTSFTEIKTVDNVPYGNYTTETVASAGATPTTGCTTAAWGKSTTNADPGSYNTVAPANSTEITSETWFWGTESRNTYPVHYMWKGETDTSFAEVKTVNDVPYGNYTTETIAAAGATPTTGCTTAAWGKSATNADPGSYNAVAPAGSTEITGETWLWATESRNTYPVHYMWKLDGSTSFAEIKTASNVPYGNYTTETLASAGATPTTGCTTAAWGKSTTNADPGSYNAVAPASSTEITGETWLWGTESRNTYPVHYMWKADGSSTFTEIKTVTGVPYGNYTTETLASAGATPTTGCTTAAWGKSATNTDPGSYNAVAPAGSTEVTGETWFWGTETRNTYPVHYMYRKSTFDPWVEVKLVENIPYGNYTTETLAQIGVTPTYPALVEAYGQTTVANAPTNLTSIVPGAVIPVKSETWLWGQEAPIVRGSQVTTYKSSDPEPNTKVQPGQEITYKLTHVNTGATVSAYSLVRDYIPAGTEYVDGSVSEGGVYVSADQSANDRAYVEWVKHAIPVLGSVESSFTVKVSAEPPAVIYNHALTSTQPDPIEPGKPDNPEPTLESNEVQHPTGDEPTSPRIEIIKLAEPVAGTYVTTGDTINYTLTVKNSGGSVAKDIAVFDAVPAHTELVSVEDVHNATKLGANSAIGWNIASLEAGASTNLKFTVKVTESSNEIVIVNQASYCINTPGIPESPLSNLSNIIEYPTIPTHIITGSQVTTYKDSDPAPNGRVEVGQEITYFLTHENTGATVSGYTLVRDYIPEGTEYVEGSVSEGGVYVPAESSLSGRAYVEWVKYAIPVLGKAESSFKVKVIENPPSIIRNFALTGTTPEPITPGDPSNGDPSLKSNEVCHTTDGTPCGPQIRIVKSAEPPAGSTVNKGNVIAYHLTVTNIGDVAANQIAVYDEIPQFTALFDYEDNFGATPNGSRSAMGWNIPNLGAGDSTVLTFRVTVTEQTAATIKNQATYAMDYEGILDRPLANSSNIVEHPINPDDLIAAIADISSTGDVLVPTVGFIMLTACAGFGTTMYLRKRRNK